MWTRRTLHTVKARKDTSKIKLWIIPRWWTSFINGQQTDKVRKNIIGVFKDIGFSFEITTNLKEVDFIEVSLNLWNGTYRPYKKLNDSLLYIRNLSNHPPNVIKQIPNSIHKRLPKNSSNEEIFRTTKCYVWHLKETLDVTPNLKWSLLRCTAPYSNISKNCVLCLYEKLVIMTYPRQHELFNKQSELFYKFCHEYKYLLKNFRVNDLIDSIKVYL